MRKYIHVTLSSSLFHDGGRYHIETSPLIWGANQCTSFYMITASVMKELMVLLRYYYDSLVLLSLPLLTC